MLGMTAVPVNAQRLEPPVTEFCQSWWTCTVAETALDIWPIMLMGAVAVGSFVALVHLERAQSLTREEKSRTRSEMEAFESFIRRVSRISIPHSTTVSPLAGGAVSRSRAHAGNRPLTEIKDAYRETVMSTPHYDQEYDEGLEANMAVEFGPDIAEAISSDTRVSPMLKQLLVSKARQAIEERLEYSATLDRELDSLEAAISDINSIESELDGYDSNSLATHSYQQLLDSWERLDRLEHRCNDVIAIRQRRIQSEPLNDAQVVGSEPLIRYLYHSLSVNYPVLDAGVAVLDRIRESRSTVIGAVCSHA